MTDPYARVELETIALEELQYRVRQLVGDEMYIRFDQMSMREYRSEAMAAMVLELHRTVHAQQLAPQTLTFDFARMVEVERNNVWRQRVPRKRVDLVLLLLPRWLRWRAPQWRNSKVWLRLPNDRRQVVIQEQVDIENLLAYPDTTMVLPPQQWGQPVMIQRVKRMPL